MSDVSQTNRPKSQESTRMEEEEEEASLYVKKMVEKFVHIKEEPEEYFIRVENPHILEQQQPHPLKKEEEDPPYVKVVVVDIPKWIGDPLMGEDSGPNEASSSSSKGFQADYLFARPSESDDFTSHSLFH
ncbi:uncharacterized protein LOC130927912 isoform X3 [Corythoichthys intestinalis]|nr:uncharacterized protein LOC130927912 isoform X3 [Corythoichthys intestinalis]